MFEHPPAYDPQSNGAAEKALQEYMEQLRVLKIALERRLESDLATKDAILEWASDHAALQISRYKLGGDGKTAFRRLMGKDCRAVSVEFGEQVLAKPKRKNKSNRKQALKSRWVEATLVGATRNSKEHVVILPGGGPAIRVRTIKRRMLSERWNPKVIKDIVATPRKPNPKDETQGRPELENQTKGVQIEESGKDLLPSAPEQKDTAKRDFRITKVILGKYNFT